MIRETLAFTRDLLSQVPDEEDRDDYGRGYVDALSQVHEYILDLLWEEGEADDDDPEA